MLVVFESPFGLWEQSNIHGRFSNLFESWEFEPRWGLLESVSNSIFESIGKLLIVF